MDIAKLDKYVKPRKQSVLTPYLDEIRYLVERGATQKSILAYLKNEEGVEVTQSYLSRFIKRYITTGDGTPKRKRVPQPVAEASIDSPTEERMEEEKSLEEMPPEKEETGDLQDEGDEISKEERDKLIEEMLKRNQNALGKWG
ncbi:MAG: hypothetical protein L3J44_08200 [Campylobacteraceae bacterium]|nr:hypothetical protein [Campylobacteraceae bacterium]